MKKFIKFGVLMLALIMTFLFSLGLSSCKHSTNNTDFVDNDSLQIAKIVNNVSNPVFTSLEDVMIYQKKIKEQHLSDSIINHVDPDILSFIADVCINRDGYTTPKKILEEYKLNLILS